MTVYCLSQGSAFAQSPAWGQLGARVRSEESWRVTIAERAERDIVFIKLSILSVHAYHISHISCNNPIHAEKSVCARFFRHSPMISRKGKAESVD